MYQENHRTGKKLLNFDTTLRKSKGVSSDYPTVDGTGVRYIHVVVAKGHVILFQNLKEMQESYNLLELVKDILY